MFRLGAHPDSCLAARHGFWLSASLALCIFLASASAHFILCGFLTILLYAWPQTLVARNPPIRMHSFILLDQPNNPLSKPSCVDNKPEVPHVPPR